MKIKILQENLNQALSYLQKAIPSKPQLPILSSIQIVVDGTTCQLSATDLYFGVRCKVQCDAEESGQIVVPGKEFKEIISSLSPGQINLEYSNNILHIASKNSKAKIQCMVSDEYPDFPISEGRKYELDSQQIEVINKQVIFSASTDQARPVLTSILFSIDKENVSVVSTDGFRLSVLTMNNIGEGVDEDRFMIPSKSLTEVFRIQKQTQEENVFFSVSHDLKQVVFKISEVEVFIRLIEGDYPPYQKIIPTNFTTNVLFDRLELIENIKRAMIFAREASNIIRFSINKNNDDSIEVLAIAPTIGEFRGSLSQIKIDGDSAKIAFNAKYVLEFLQSVNSDQISFFMSESLKPVVFRPLGQLGYQYVVMPFKVTD